MKFISALLFLAFLTFLTATVYATFPLRDAVTAKHKDKDSQLLSEDNGAVRNELETTNRAPTYIKCESYDRKRKECFLPQPLNSLFLHILHSKTACIEFETYFKGYRSVIVDGGCRATFVYTLKSAPLKPVYFVNCASGNFQPATCYVSGNIDFVYVHDKRSKSLCVEGHSFYKNGNTLTVDKGCRATFGYTLL